MPQINIGQQGLLKSTPKICRINGDDLLKLVYRNMGNNHAYPFLWSETVTVASGTDEITIVSGVRFHGMSAASYCNVVVTCLSDLNAVNYWIDKDTVNNVIKLKIGSTAGADFNFDIMVMVGVDPNVSTISCRGNTGATQALP